jgi:hypothetical protein
VPGARSAPQLAHVAAVAVVTAVPQLAQKRASGCSSEPHVVQRMRGVCITTRGWGTGQRRIRPAARHRETLMDYIDSDISAESFGSASC